MSTSPEAATAEQLRAALKASDSSDRLRVALAAGTDPHDEYVEVLVQRCAVEPDFYVRDMMTWALTRHPADLTVPLLLDEAKHGEAQAKSQALHSLSKIRDRRGWEAVTRELLLDDDDEVARAAWRTGVVLVPEGGERELADILVSQLGRGGRSLQLSLSRALVALGDAAAEGLAVASRSKDLVVRTHAIVTERLMLDPDDSYDSVVFEAQRIIAMGAEPSAGQDDAGDGVDGAPDR